MATKSTSKKSVTKKPATKAPAKKAPTQKKKSPAENKKGPVKEIVSEAKHEAPAEKPKKKEIKVTTTAAPVVNQKPVVNQPKEEHSATLNTNAAQNTNVDPASLTPGQRDELALKKFAEMVEKYLIDHTNRLPMSKKAAFEWLKASKREYMVSMADDITPGRSIITISLGSHQVVLKSIPLH